MKLGEEYGGIEFLTLPLNDLLEVVFELFELHGVLIEHPLDVLEPLIKEVVENLLLAHLKALCGLIEDRLELLDLRQVESLMIQEVAALG